MASDLDKAKLLKYEVLEKLDDYKTQFINEGDFETAARCRESHDLIKTGSNITLERLVEYQQKWAKIKLDNDKLQSEARRIKELEERLCNAEERATLAFNESRKRGDRIYEFEQEIAGLKCDLYILRVAFNKINSEVERLRKAIEEALDHGVHSSVELILEAALTPPTAADSTNCNQQSSDCNNQANLGIKHPTAASGEKAFTIDPQWLLKMADAEDAVGGLAIGMSPFVSQPPSAPAAGSADYDRGVECDHE